MSVAKDVVTSEFYAVQKEIAELNQEFGDLDFLKRKLYWFPYRRKESLDHMKSFWKVSNFNFLSDAYFGWGLNPRTLSLMKRSIKEKKPFFFVEDGFIRSLYHGGCAPRFRLGRSFTVDAKAPYYCGDLETDLESKISDTTDDSYDCFDVSCTIKKIIDTQLSKYNHQPPASKLSKNGNKIILVIGQNYGDKSLQFGGVGDDVFDLMLEDALSTGADVYYKVHPDVIDTNSESRTDPRIHFLREGCNPISLLKQVDQVYVATSQMGFEALLLGKPVKVYGKPFYAGWGLTEDVMEFPRRKKMKKLEDIFYATYLSYTHYLDLENKNYTTLSSLMNTLLDQRKECFGY